MVTQTLYQVVRTYYLLLLACDRGERRRENVEELQILLEKQAEEYAVLQEECQVAFACT